MAAVTSAAQDTVMEEAAESFNERKCNSSALRCSEYCGSVKCGCAVWRCKELILYSANEVTLQRTNF